VSGIGAAARLDPLAFWSLFEREALPLLNPTPRYAIDSKLGSCPPAERNLTDQKQFEDKKSKIAPVQIYWTTVTYKTVAVYIVLIFAIVMLSLYLILPDWTTAMVRKATDAMGGSGDTAPPAAFTQARFVNLDGKVQVKKVNSVQWNTADYRMTLDKGDLIQTGTDGVARLTFADGTTYTVKQETLITVEENTVGPDRPTRVGVSIASGALDLSTAGWDTPGSKAEVRFPQDQSVASLHGNSRATVRSDPDSKQNEITVSTGAADLNRGQEHVELGPHERASFQPGGVVAKSQVLSPPSLTQPTNLQPIIVPEPKQTAVKFGWEAVAEAVHYTLKISATSTFAHVLTEKKVTGTSVDITGLGPGDYFWMVTATDAQNRTSEASDIFKFTLAAQGKGEEMLLEVEGTQLHGSVVEVTGRTEPGATLLVNGQSVSQVDKDGRFQYFTPPMTRGSQTIVIIGQNRRGGTAIKKVPIVVP
jgi:hypothetical protein